MRHVPRLHLRLPVLALWVLLISVGLVACSSSGPPDSLAFTEDASHDHPSKLDDRGRFSGSDGEWPPQPKNAQGIRALDVDPLLPDAEEREVLAAAQDRDGDEFDRGRFDRSIVSIAKQDRRVAELLGDEFVFAASDRSGGKKKGRSRNGSADHEVEFFSRDSNVTVDVVVRGDQVVEVDSRRADEYQPPLQPEEVEEAIDLARSYWITNGRGQASAYEGFGIRAFKPGGDFYDVRMVYVSFHNADDGGPELLTWVDLTNQIVSAAREDS